MSKMNFIAYNHKIIAYNINFYIYLIVFRSLLKFWQRELTKKGADLNLIDLFGTIGLQRPYFWFSVFEYIMDDSQIVTKEADNLYPKNPPLSEEAKKNIEHYKNGFEFYNPDPEKS